MIDIPKEYALCRGPHSNKIAIQKTAHSVQNKYAGAERVLIVCQSLLWADTRIRIRPCPCGCLSCAEQNSGSIGQILKPLWL